MEPKTYDANDKVIYCPECSHITENLKGVLTRPCCPDSNHAILCHREIAEQARIGFQRLYFIPSTGRHK